VQKNQFGQNAQGESEWFFSVAAAKLGFIWTEKHLYITCFTSLD
jgi:hypothetical protein